MDQHENLSVLGVANSPGGYHKNLIVFPGLEKIVVDEHIAVLKRKPVNVLGAEIDRNIEIRPSYMLPSNQMVR